MQDPLTGAVFTTLSDADGHFEFIGMANGIYVLHVDAGIVLADREYASTDLLIRLSDTAGRDTLLLARQDGGGTSCGDTSLELRNSPN